MREGGGRRDEMEVGRRVGDLHGGYYETMHLPFLLFQEWCPRLFYLDAAAAACTYLPIF
jgi:hypothetical protein